MQSPTVGVVIPAYNCEKTILNTLHAVLAQTHANINLIVVDDGSTDKTAEIIRSVQGVRCVYQDNAGPAMARNRGAQEVKNDLIFFTDSDCIPHKDWIEKALGYFEDPSVAVVAGSYGIANPENLLARCVHKEILYRHHRLMPLYPKVFGSYNFGIRKRIFEIVGGFNTSYRHASGEDNDLSYKILKAGYKIYFAKEVLVNHYHPERVKKYLREQYRHGFWRVQMYLDHPSMMKGDDYTFWKDRAEVGFVSLIVLNLIVSKLFLPSGFTITFFLFLFLFTIEGYYSWAVTKNFVETIFFTFVMLLRAFVRTFGFSSGVLRIFPKKFIKKS
ncbi:MAG: hypothetical protein A2Y04_01760 [Omnitrophica WOR_2 bacterium GWC2_45_7]|nr:MAG: hypothetical protein A2Y04_01760 [Omnitrophica WOR_2 bacterium GWC2_45_7]